MVLDVAANQPVEIGHLVDVLELVERDQRAVAPALLEPQRQVEERVQSGQRVGLRVELDAGADPVHAEREPDAGALQELVDARPHRALQVARVGPFEPNGHVGDRGDPVEVDEHRDQPLLPLAVGEHPAQQARLAVLPRRIEPDVVAADRVREQRAGLVVPVDDLVGRERMRVDEGVDVRQHSSNRLPVGRLFDY